MQIREGNSGPRREKYEVLDRDKRQTKLFSLRLPSSPRIIQSKLCGVTAIEQEFPSAEWRTIVHAYILAYILEITKGSNIFQNSEWMFIFRMLIMIHSSTQNVTKCPWKNHIYKNTLIN